MKRFGLMLLLAAWTLALGQSAVGSAAPSVERARIEAQRQQELTRYAQQEQACSEKFFVNDCMVAVKTQRRETLAQLQRQEVALNDAERRRSAAQKSEVVQKKSAQTVASPVGSNQQTADRLQRKTQEKALAQSQSEAAARDRAAQQAQKKKEHMKQDAAAAAPGAAAAEKNQHQYQKKRADAAQHKAAVKKRQNAKTKPQALPLPNPP